MSKLPRLFAPKRRGDAGAPAGSPVSGRAGVGSWRLLAWAPLILALFLWGLDTLLGWLVSLAIG